MAPKGLTAGLGGDSLSAMTGLKPYWEILIALALAVFFGWLLGGPLAESSAGVVSGFAFVGDLFISALKLLIVPLVMSSIVAGIAGLGKIEGFGRLGLKTIGYYALSSLMAICIGLVVVDFFKPGFVDGAPNPVLQEHFSEPIDNEKIEDKVRDASARAEGGLENVLLVFKALVPGNLIKAMAEGNLLGLIFFSILVAIAIVKSGAVAKPVIDFVVGFNEVMIRMTRWIIALAPVGILGLVVPVIADMGGDSGELLKALAKYVGVVLLALGLHYFVALPLLLRFLGGISPRRHFAAMRQALLTAFSTASSSATLPVTLRNLRDNAGVSRRTSNFVLPLGATVNMDGTALYECVAVLFVAQVLGWEMGAAQQFMVVALALLTSIGVAGIPSASLVAILIIMNSVGIPNPEIAMGVLLTVDRILDMCRTSLNVFSDSCGAAIIARSEGESGVLNGGVISK